jgi:hypothetical protein
MTLREVERLFRHVLAPCRGVSRALACWPREVLMANKVVGYRLRNA